MQSQLLTVFRFRYFIKPEKIIEEKIVHTNILSPAIQMQLAKFRENLVVTLMQKENTKPDGGRRLNSYFTVQDMEKNKETNTIWTIR